MNIQLTGHHNDSGSGAQGPVGPRKIAISPDGSRMIAIGNFKYANGILHDQILNVLIGAQPAATIDPNWNTAAYTAYCFNGAFDTYMKDVDFSPDGSYFAVGVTGGRGTNTDGTRSTAATSVARWNTADTGSDVRPIWADYTGQDTIESVAVTGTAVYVGGHQRWMNNPNGFDYAGAGAVPRPGLAALDPISGVPLAWNPGRNPRGIGATALLATSTGLWVGSDTTYIGNYQYYRGRIALLPARRRRSRTQLLHRPAAFQRVPSGIPPELQLHQRAVPGRCRRTGDHRDRRRAGLAGRHHRSQPVPKHGQQHGPAWPRAER